MDVSTRKLLHSCYLPTPSGLAGLRQWHLAATVAARPSSVGTHDICLLCCSNLLGANLPPTSPLTNRSVCFYSSKLDEAALHAWTCGLLTAHGLLAAGNLRASDLLATSSSGGAATGEFSDVDSSSGMGREGESSALAGIAADLAADLGLAVTVTPC